MVFVVCSLQTYAYYRILGRFVQDRSGPSDACAEFPANTETIYWQDHGVNMYLLYTVRRDHSMIQDEDEREKDV